MFFRISPSNGVPVYEQVIRQVTFAVANGALRPGQMVPSVRQLAKELTINPNTVARAYRELQNDGILSAVRGTGLEVAADSPAHCRSERYKIINQQIKQVVDEARQSQLIDDEIRDLFEGVITRSTGETAVDDNQD